MPKIVTPHLAEHRHTMRESLLDALDELLVERAFDQITMSEIATRAGVARNTIYNYAADKNVLLLAAVRRSTGRLEESVRSLVQGGAGPAPQRLAAVVELLLLSFGKETHRVFVLQSRFHSLTASNQAIATDSVASVQSGIAGIISDGTKAGEFRGLGDSRLEVEFISAVMAVAVKNVASDPVDARGVVDATVSFILRALS